MSVFRRLRRFGEREKKRKERRNNGKYNGLLTLAMLEQATIIIIIIIIIITTTTTKTAFSCGLERVSRSRLRSLSLGRTLCNAAVIVTVNTIKRHITQALGAPFLLGYYVTYIILHTNKLLSRLL